MAGGEEEKLFNGAKFEQGWLEGALFSRSTSLRLQSSACPPQSGRYPGGVVVKAGILCLYFNGVRVLGKCNDF